MFKKAGIPLVAITTGYMICGTCVSIIEVINVEIAILQKHVVQHIALSVDVETIRYPRASCYARLVSSSHVGDHLCSFREGSVERCSS